MSEKLNVVAALAAVMEDVRAVAKNDRNPQQHYAFRGIDAVVNAVGPVLRRHGVVVVPTVEEIGYRDVQTSTGKASRECTVRVRYTFYGPAGDHIDCVTPGESLDFGDKGAPKAMSVAFRIALLQALCLPTDDPDPDGQQYERGERVPQQRQEAPTQQRTSGNGSPDPATVARQYLADVCAKNKWDLKRVADRYRAQYKEELGHATDGTRITAFTKLLYGMSDTELKPVSA